MSHSKNKPIDPFLAAKRQVGVHVSLGLHDVRAQRPQWNDEKAKMFLDRFASVIAAGMLMAGTQLLRELLEGHDHEC